MLYRTWPAPSMISDSIVHRCVKEPCNWHDIVWKMPVAAMKRAQTKRLFWSTTKLSHRPKWNLKEPVAPINSKMHSPQKQRLQLPKLLRKKSLDLSGIRTHDLHIWAQFFIPNATYQQFSSPVSFVTKAATFKKNLSCFGSRFRTAIKQECLPSQFDSKVRQMLLSSGHLFNLYQCHHNKGFHYRSICPIEITARKKMREWENALLGKQNEGVGKGERRERPGRVNEREMKWLRLV